MSIEPKNQVTHDQALPLENLLAHRFSRTHARLSAHVTQILKQHGDLTKMQWRILLVLDHLDESSVTQLVRVTQLDKALISRTVRGMLDRGLLTSEANSKDMRVQILRMTDTGRTAYETAAPHVRQWHTDLHNTLTEEERQTFYRVNEKIEKLCDEAG